MLDTYLKWFQAHERLLLVVVIVGFGLWGFNHWVDRDVETKIAQAAVSKQLADVQAAANREIDTQVAKLNAQYLADRDVRDKEIASLVAAIASRDAVTKQKIAEVTAPKSAQDAVKDLSTAYTLPVPVTVTDGGAIVPTVDIQQFTVAKIERDTFESDLRDTQTQLGDAQGNVAQAETVIAGLHTQVDGLNSAIVKNGKAAQDELAEVKAKARKSKWNLFKWGVVVGFVGRQAIKSGTGL